ncbi:MAG: hypothetical protein OXH32_01610 [Acidobacteria bacterium]|nr:hypothetical protein [Acidobacteriota bacterium]
MARHHKLIQNYGLFWDRDKVDWGKNKATLLGRLKVRDDAVDFRGQLGIYALYDREFRLLYVGQAGSGNNTLFSRLKYHGTLHAGTRGLASRWRYFSWFGLLRVLKGSQELAEPPKTHQTKRADILDALEAVAIEIADPDLNRQGGRLRAIEEYLQYEEAVEE